MNFARLTKLLGSATGVVAALFAVSGSALTDLAPPVSGIAAKVGLANVVLLALLLMISLYSRDRIGRHYNNLAVATGCAFLVLGLALYFSYARAESRYVFVYPPNGTGEVSKRYVRGELHEIGKRRVGAATVAAAVADNGGLPYVLDQQLLWTEASQRDIEFRLTVLYLAFVSLVGGGIFWFLVRLVDGQPHRKPARKGKARKPA